MATQKETVATPANVERVRELFQEQPATSTRRAAQQLGLSHMTVHNILTKKLDMFPYKIQIQQPLKQVNFDQRFDFANEILERIRMNEIDVKRIHFSDECYFHLDGYVNKQNFRFWGTENPHLSAVKSAHPEKVNVWCSISFNGIIGPYFMTKYVDEEVYRDQVLAKFLPEARQKGLVRNHWFQQDGATPHRTQENLDQIAHVFGHRILGLDANRKTGGGIDWPSSSPDLNVCDFFLWGYLKDRVYKTPLGNVDELAQRIIDEIGAINEEIRQRATLAFESRLHHLVASKGEHFENALH